MKSGIVSLLSLAALAVLGCTNEEAPQVSASDSLGPTRVATVDGQAIPESVFRVYSLSALQRNPDELSQEEKDRVIDDLVLLKVIANEAEKEGLPTERRLAAELELMRQQAIARALTQRFQEKNPPSEADLRALYEENLPRLATTQYKARHILVDSEELATDLITQLDNGADFAELARENSKDTTSTDGGDLGWFSADTMVAPFADAVRGLEVGKYSETPVQTRFGWHVILLEDSKDQQPPGLEAVRDELTQAVSRQKLDVYVRGLRDAAEVSLGSE